MRRCSEFLTPLRLGYGWRMVWGNGADRGGAAGACLLPPLARVTLVDVKTMWRILLSVPTVGGEVGTRPVTLRRCFVVHVSYQ